MRQVKIICNSDYEKLEDEVNQFIASIAPYNPDSVTFTEVVVKGKSYTTAYIVYYKEAQS